MNTATMIVNKKKKTTQGRKKIEIKKIDNVSHRQVTFSKRRGGLFKKASELCILTGAEVAIIIQSSGKRVYAFGHPTVEGVIERYYSTNGSHSTAPSMSRSTLSAAEIEEHNSEYNRLCEELEAERTKLMEVQEKAKFVNNFWWDEDVDDLGLEELEMYVAAMEELRKNVITRADELALLKNSQSLGIMNNVDLNQTMATATTVGVLAREDSIVPYEYQNSEILRFD